MSTASSVRSVDVIADGRVALVAAALSRAGFAQYSPGDAGGEAQGFAISTMGWDGGEVVVVEPVPQGAGAQARVEQYCHALRADPTFAAWRIRPMVLGLTPSIHRIWMWPWYRSES